MKWGKPRILLLVIVALSAAVIVSIGLLFAIDPWVFALLVVFAFAPPAVYLFWLRNTERNSHTSLGPWNAWSRTNSRRWKSRDESQSVGGEPMRSPTTSKPYRSSFVFT